MRLQWFEIQGYKNIRKAVRLDALGRFNVLHGDNNVGKSNLLESIGLFFTLLRALREEVRGEVSKAESFARRKPPERAAGESTVRLRAMRTFSYLAGHDFPPDEIFNLQDAEPMEFRASIHLEAGDLERDAASWLSAPLELELRLERREDAIWIELTRLKRSDGADLADQSDIVHALDLGTVLDLLSPRRLGDRVHPRFALIRADRTLAGETSLTQEGPAPLMTREPLPRDLGLELYDAENSTDLLERQRFERFLQALGHFQDFLGPGQWRMRFDRQADRAELLFDGASGRVPLRLMGSGLQQIVTLLARLVMTRADIVALEEPELNLRYKTQLQLREVLSTLVSEASVPSQILVTSHSGAFETEEMFYAVLRSEDGPRVERWHRKEAARFTQSEANVPPAGKQAPLSYVTSEGLVLLPEEVRKALGLERGGGVTFVPEKSFGHYRMLTDAQFLDMIEPREPSP
jgi:predicted ATPase